jgi:hypothetical protein
MLTELSSRAGKIEYILDLKRFLQSPLEEDSRSQGSAGRGCTLGA